MLIRVCDICHKKMKNYWNFKTTYITFGDKVENTGRAINLEICDECMNKMQIPDVEEYGYVSEI